jgi:hypothetical protein
MTFYNDVRIFLGYCSLFGAELNLHYFKDLLSPCEGEAKEGKQLSS